MPEDVRDDYDEARTIVGLSPRGACALLRLAVQRLCGELGESGKNIDSDIASLVEKGLTPDVQEALDSLRVIGNNAVHPGEMDLKDDTETAAALFNLLNFIVEDRIAQPKKRKAIFDKLPEGAKAAIRKRDGQRVRLLVRRRTDGRSLVRRDGVPLQRSGVRFSPHHLLGRAASPRRKTQQAGGAPRPSPTANTAAGPRTSPRES